VELYGYLCAEIFCLFHGSSSLTICKASIFGKQGRSYSAIPQKKLAYNVAEPTNFQIFAQKRKKAAGSIEKSTLPAANKCVLWVYRGGRRVQVCYDSQNSEKYLFVRDKL
jgi:hypothetical protein